MWYRRLQVGLLFQEADYGHLQKPWYCSNYFWKTLGTIESDPQNSVQTKDCVELSCVAMIPIQLNVSALSDLYSFFVSLPSSLILGQDHLNKILLQALVNSRSTHCFVDLKFVDIHYLKTSAISLVALCLFDSSSNSTISEIANLSIIFSTGDCITLNFYVTLLDSSYSLILEYNWLTWHNPLID